MKGFLGSLLGSLLIFAPLALAADAAEGTYLFEDFAVPNPNRPPTVRTLLVIDTSDLAGQTCQVIVDTVNGESVHPENYITVTGGTPAITVTGTEDGAFGVKQNTTSVVMGDQLEVRNHFQYATSVEGDVIVSCQSTTTTTSATSTTTPPTSTTTSTTPSSTTTTAPTPSTTTSVPPAPPTTAPTDSTTTTVPPVTSPPTLPFTGPGQRTVGISMAAAAMVLLGAGVLAALREVEK